MSVDVVPVFVKFGPNSTERGPFRPSFGQAPPLELVPPRAATLQSASRKCPSENFHPRRAASGWRCPRGARALVSDRLREETLAQPLGGMAHAGFSQKRATLAELAALLREIQAWLVCLSRGQI